MLCGELSFSICRHQERFARLLAINSSNKGELSMKVRSLFPDAIRKIGSGNQIAAVFLSFLLSAGAFAQSNSGDVTGTISDASGAALQGATVTASNEATNVKTAVTANAEGTYRFTNLLVGSYTITAAAKGFTS